MADDTGTSNSPSQCCALCGESGSSLLRCSQCQSVWYCNKTCQKKHWKGHKETCFPPNATCTRCLEPIVKDENGVVTTTCQVSHPTHFLQDYGSSWAPGGAITLQFNCLACEKQFSKKGSRGSAEWTYQPSTFQWCYQGRHTVKPLKDNDQCRVHQNVELILIQAGETTEAVQEAINNIDKDNVRVLVIQPANGGFNEDVEPKLDLVMPNLEEIKLLDVGFSKIVLNSTTTPKLKQIEMQNVPDECLIDIQCPTLEHFDGRHHRGDHCDRWVNKMLKKATRLQTFRSYKLGLSGRPQRPIQFASTMLTELHIHRSDCLSDLTIWAPRLQYLRLQGCYSLESIKFPKNHPDLSKELASSFIPTPFTVETTNSCLSNAVIETLSNHTRCVWDGDEVDETAGVGGSGMEAMFRLMHQSF